MNINIFLPKLIFLGLVFSVLGVSLSIPMMNAGLAIFLVAILLNVLNKSSYIGSAKNFFKPDSRIVLFIFSIFLILSICVNYSSYNDLNLFFGAILKVRYYLIPTFMIPFLLACLSGFSGAKKKYVLVLFFIAILLANLSGIAAMFFGGFNFLKSKLNQGCIDRNCGMFDIMTYAHNSAILLLILWSTFVFEKKRNDKLSFFVFRRIVFIVGLMGFYLSYTFGAWAAFFLALPFIYLFNWKKFILSGIISLVCLGMWVKMPSTDLARPSAMHAESRSIRVSQWQAAWITAKQNPFFGIGLLNFEPKSIEIKKAHKLDHQDFSGHVHNSFLQFFAEGGMLGGLLFIAWLFAWLRDLIIRNDWISRLFYPIWLAIIISSLTQSTMIFAGNTFLYFMAYAISMAYPSVKIPHDKLEQLPNACQ